MNKKIKELQDYILSAKTFNNQARFLIKELEDENI